MPRNAKYLQHYSLLKVKCNEIWTIFVLLKILFKNISYTNRKQDQIEMMRTILYYQYAKPVR